MKKPEFQSNCSELIADFKIKDIEEMRKILIYMIDKFKISINCNFFTNEVNTKLFKKQISSFNIKINKIKFFVEYEFVDSCNCFSLHLYAKKNNAKKLVNYICLKKDILFLKEELLLDLKEKLGLIAKEYEFYFKLIKNEIEITLAYGENGYNNGLGFYFDNKGDFEISSFPFIELAEKKFNAEVKTYDGGKEYFYSEFLNNEERTKLWE
jgi:hypothetical protein